MPTNVHEWIDSIILVAGLLLAAGLVAIGLWCAVRENRDHRDTLKEYERHARARMIAALERELGLDDARALWEPPSYWRHWERGQPLDPWEAVIDVSGRGSYAIDMRPHAGAHEQCS